jgi:hypothetical protein
MVCYARPAIRMAALVLAAFLIFERPAGHFFDAAALVVVIAVAVAIAAVAAAAAFAVFLSTRRRRARAGGCVACTLRCQHAMTEGPRRFRLVSIADRTPSTSSASPFAPVAAGVRAVAPTGRSLPVVSINGRTAPAHYADRPAAVALPSPRRPVPVPVPAGPDAPQWPDRPARRVRERVGS